MKREELRQEFVNDVLDLFNNSPYGHQTRYSEVANRLKLKVEELESKLTEPKQSDIPSSEETNKWFVKNIKGGSAANAVHKYRMWLLEPKQSDMNKDIRNKLSPIKNLIAMIQTPKDLGESYLQELAVQAKESVEYLANLEKQSEPVKVPCEHAVTEQKKLRCTCCFECGEILDVID